ncbi:DUF3305 domain-containing protein [Roseibium polysiphoniae]|uniref:DUF3305 domain-containing protein n=1 Tax=Roseibium polysiphoniae TaxID=2571221 RepID=A0ABR9C572_9HYPH|nr:DUF3305 domain-containing protein [Roseibium polysiphoniae]MBD8875022.1 DUF3305 domain-containing protein [Roseibium polysiphoniae]
MEVEITRQVCIVLEQRKSQHAWVDHTWLPVAVLPDSGGDGTWQEAEPNGDARVFTFGPVALTLHRRMGEAYDANIETEAPALWVMLDDADSEPVPFKVRGVTADPYEAMGALDSGEGMVERLPVPTEILHWMVDYLKQMPDPEKFRKRKRVPHSGEELKFGKVPIFEPGGRREGTTRDDT